MNQEIIARLEKVLERFHELSLLLVEPEIINKKDKFLELSLEYSDISELAKIYENYKSNQIDLREIQELLNSLKKNDELYDISYEELALLKKTLAATENDLLLKLISNDPDDKAKKVYLEIRAGTGGDEAAIFAGDLLRMYSRYAEISGWGLETLNLTDADLGGYKEAVVLITGNEVYKKLKFESGAHRVQRVPETESQGRVHTSAATVAIIPETEALAQIELDSKDLRIDTFRASGAGGQHVNKTDSAIRITHIPTGTVVECQEERSQHKNKAKALSLLSARIMDKQKREKQAEEAAQRKSLVGTGDRSDRIRTYNFPQGRVSDHRINLTLYQLDDFMEGNLDPVISKLIAEEQACKLAEL